MSKLIKVLGIQIEPCIGNKKANIEKVENFLNQYQWFKPDLVVLPEVFSTGIISPEKFLQEAEEVPGPTYEKMSLWAKELNCYLLGGSIIEQCQDNKCRNSSMLFSPTGDMLAKYYKLHMFSYYGSQEGKFSHPGDSAVIVKTPIGNIGMTVCYDLRFTELYRSLTFNGAQIITVPAAWPYPRLDHWVTLNKARAIENQCFIIAVNQAGYVPPKRMNCANSMVINPWGSVIACASDKETAMMAEIDLEEVSKLREEFPVFNDINFKAYANIKSIG